MDKRLVANLANADREWFNSSAPRCSNKQFNSIKNNVTADNASLTVDLGSNISLSKSVNEAFDEVITWRSNLFRLPKCAESSKFVSILAAVYESFVLRTFPSDEVFKLTVLLPQLVLQRNGVMPISTRRKILLRRLKMWSNKEYVELLSEARELQSQLRFSKRQQKGSWQIQFTDSMKKVELLKLCTYFRKEAVCKVFSMFTRR
ncbi:hypothetical protein GJ496_010088 [Pomphorhynchus laevis]|nr:hypothetical protein GJ496_010088 [Pomphorhynchus laevis]